MTDIKLLLSYRNTWNHKIVCKKKRAQVRLKMFSMKCVYKSYIFNMYIKTGFGIK